MNIIKKQNVYVIVGESTEGTAWRISSHYGKRYVNFNRNSKSKNPKMVTGCGHFAYNQVYFESKLQANNFLQKFINNQKRLDCDFEVKCYKGKYKDANATPVKTIYGDCLMLS